MAFNFCFGCVPGWGSTGTWPRPLGRGSICAFCFCFGIQAAAVDV